MSPGRDQITAGYRRIQAEFAAALDTLGNLEGFRRQQWERPGGGGGESWTLSGEGPIERAAVNVSAVHGEAPAISSEISTTDGGFFATGVSIIVHPRDPHAPTFHANLRYFEAGTEAWFGGGSDLTPHYLFAEDAQHFHGVLRRVCARHEVADYAAWKDECDRYFHLPHRGEARGIGGIFFDRLTDRRAEVWQFQMDLGRALTDAYLPILERRVGTPHGPSEKYWQEVRRGRYVEFNLVWDKGTRFGLDTGGRTASVLASLPPRARWDEDLTPVAGSPEADLLAFLSGPPRDW